MLNRTRAVLSALALAGALLLGVGVTPAQASSYYCSGYTGCLSSGHSDAGYRTAGKSSYWRMAAGHNCTNYAAYRLVRAGLRNVRPWAGTGNAYNWGPANPMRTDRTPLVGAIAWWKAGVKGAGSKGHVAYVEKVVSIDEIIISEDNWGGTFHWRRVVRSSGWPSGFVHFKDAGVGSPRGSVDGAISLSSHRLALRGWAADPNAPAKAVRLRVYVGGRPGIGRRYDLNPATKRRADVAKAHRAYGANHGFNQTITVKATGRTVIYVYGLDTAGTAGTTALLGRPVVTIAR